MPLTDQELSKDRINFEANLSPEEIEFLIQNHDIKFIQTTGPIAVETWNNINQDLLVQRPDIELRIYGFYSQICDLSFLQYLKNVKRLSVDCIENAIGIENISALQNLECLSIGISNLENFDFLETLNHQKMISLSLAATKSKQPHLSCLPKFTNLKSLYLESQQKGIESIVSLLNLEKLVLHSISVVNLDFIKSLPSLWSLEIKLGGTKNLTALSEKDSLKHLEIYQVQGLEDISVISTLTGLQYLCLQSLSKIKNIPDLIRLKNLRRIYLENLKSLENFNGIELAPALEEFVHSSVQAMEPSQYEGILKMKNLKKASVRFGSDKKNKAFQYLLKQNDIALYKYSDFKFI